MKKIKQVILFVCLCLMFFSSCVYLEAASKPAKTTFAVHKHSYKKNTSKKATCTDTGLTEYNCKCGKSYTKPTAEIPHDLDENNMCKMCGSECIVHKNGQVTVTVPKKTDRTTVYVNVKTNEGKTMIYHIFDQDKKKFDKNDEYMKLHGCAISCLTSVLNTKVLTLSCNTPDQIIASVEKKVLGTSLFKENYNRTVEKQMPITLYGMTKIFDEYDISYKYVYNFSDSTAVKEIIYNLKKGNPIIICVRSSPDKKWSGYAHVMLLIGLTNDGKAIICDSMNRDWSGTEQRIKYAKVDELVKYMKSTKKKPTDLYWSSGSGKDGYILVY